MQLHSTPKKESVSDNDAQQPAEPVKEKEPKRSPERKSKPKALLIALLAAGILGAGTFGYQKFKASTPTADISAFTVPVESKTVTIRIKASGIVRPIQTVNLSPKTTGRIAEIYVEQGDWVEQGQVVARMENQDVQAEIVQAQANLAAAQARLAKLEAGSRPEEISEAQARLDKARASLSEAQTGSRREDIAEAQAGVARSLAQVEEARSRLQLAAEQVRRNQQLYNEGAISREDLDRQIDEEQRAQASLAQFEAGVREARQRLERLENGSRPEEISRAQADVAQAQSQLNLLLNGTRPEEITQAQAEVRQAEGRLQAVEVQLEDTLIRAPFECRITQKYATIGAFVAPTTSASTTSSATSTSIVALAKGLEILAKVPEADISQIKSGQQVEIVADAYPDEVFKGRVNLIALEAIKERDVTLFEVRLHIDSGIDQLQSGMNVDLTFLGDRLDNALVVPTVAIVMKKGETGVLIPNEKNQPTFQAVTIGPTIGNQIQILDGLQAEQKVFINLPEGQKMEDILK